MEKNIETLINKLSFTSITIATLILLLPLYHHQNPKSCTIRVGSIHPKSTCNVTHRRPFTTVPKHNHRIWATKSWARTVQSYKAELEILQAQHQNLFTRSSRVVIIGSGSGQPVKAFHEMGVHGVTGVEVVESVPLVGRGDPHNLPFSNDVFDFGLGPFFERALFPARCAGELERVVRVGGACAVAVDECGGDEVEEVVQLFKMSELVLVKNVSFGGEKRTCIVMRVVK